jgi:nitrogen fixation NifU-like protein
MSALTILVKGKPLIHAKRLSEDDVLEAIGGLPPSKQECAEFTIKTLKKALAKYEESQAP